MAPSVLKASLLSLLLCPVLHSREASALPQVNLSRIECRDSVTVQDRRCSFHNVYIVDHVVWVITEEPVEVPKLLCTAVDAPPKYVRHCNIESHRHGELIARLTEEGVRLLSYDSAIAFSRLNPLNMYHTMMEDHMPIFELLHNTPQLNHWLQAVNGNATSSQLILFQDRYSRSEPGTEATRLLYPDARFIEGPSDPAAVFHVRLLVAGTMASCVHTGHCRRGQFLTRDLGTFFRRYALQRAGVDPEAAPASPPRVTLVQRGGTRRIANLDEVVAAVNSAIAAQVGPGAKNVTVVDFGKLNVRQQMMTALQSDLLLMVHGGVYGNLVFLPRHAVVIDIYPYAFHPEQHGYHLNGIYLTMPSMHYGQLLVQTNDSNTTLVAGGVCYEPAGCSGVRTTTPLHRAMCLLVDPEQMARAVRQALLAWGAAVAGGQPTPAAAGAMAAVYAPPPSTPEFRARSAEFTQARLSSDLPSCDVHRQCDPAVLERFRAGGHCPVPR